MNAALIKSREADDYAEALRRIYAATKPPHHSKAARHAHQIARDALDAWGRKVCNA